MSNQVDNEFFGTTNLEAGRYKKNTWHKLLRGNNFFRVVPPVHSLRESGKISQFFSTHNAFKSSKGYTLQFQCPEVKDFKTKTITTPCPLCNHAKSLKDKYDTLKKEGKATVEQLKLLNEQVMLFQAQKKYYLNAINGAGEVGILPIAYKLHGALVEFLKDQRSKGKDPTGINGAYLNFSKQSPYDGSPDVSYSCALAMDEQADGSYKLRPHTIDAAALAAIKSGAVDLTTLYRELSNETIATLMAAKPSERPALVDGIFDTLNAAKDEAADTTATSSQETDETDHIAASVDSASDALAAINAVMTPAVTATTVATPNSAAKSVETTLAAPTSTPAVDIGTVGDDEFMAMIGAK